MTVRSRGYQDRKTRIWAAWNKKKRLVRKEASDRDSIVCTNYWYEECAVFSYCLEDSNRSKELISSGSSMRCVVLQMREINMERYWIQHPAVPCKALLFACVGRIVIIRRFLEHTETSRIHMNLASCKPTVLLTMAIEVLQGGSSSRGLDGVWTAMGLY